jgi:MFS superfamily sulfate permease-like transporter
MKSRLQRYVPIVDWGSRYTKKALGNDMIAAVIVTIMLIPQSLAYALLAGLPPEAGIYASIVPIILYAALRHLRALAVGPVAVVSLMTAAAVGQVAEQGTAGYAVAALTLAVLSGGFLCHGFPAAGLSRQFPQPSGHRGLHHRVGHPDRDQPAQAHPRHRGAWPYAPRCSAR